MFCCTRQFLIIYDYFPSHLKGSNYKPPRPQEKPSMQTRYIKPVMNAPFPYLLIQSKTGKTFMLSIHPFVRPSIHPDIPRSGLRIFSLPFSFQTRLTLRMESCILERRHAFHQGPVERAYMTYNRLVSTVIVLAPYLNHTTNTTAEIWKRGQNSLSG